MKESKKEALMKFHQQHILKASEELFIEKGFNKTTMDDIAKRAEYSKATLYVYFKSKDEIINYLALKSMKLLQEHLHEALMKEKDFFETYKEICYEFLNYYEESPLYFDISLNYINLENEALETMPVLKEIFKVGEAINIEVGGFLKKGIDLEYVQEGLPILPTIFWFMGSLSGVIKIGVQKQAYIVKTMKMNKQEFLDFSFKKLLDSILKEGVQNVY